MRQNKPTAFLGIGRFRGDIDPMGMILTIGLVVVGVVITAYALMIWART